MNCSGVTCVASLLMHKYNAHGATDVGGYGLLGHANNLATIQKNEVGFVIHNLPVIAKMAAVSKACGNMFGLLQGHAAETSGNYCQCRFAIMCLCICMSLGQTLAADMLLAHL